MFFVFRGIKLFYRDPRAWKYALLPFLLMTLIYIALGAGVLLLIGSVAIDSLPEWGNGILRVVMYISAVLTIFILLPLLTASTLYEVCGGLFFDSLAGYWERKYFACTVPEVSWREIGRFTFESVLFAVKTSLLQLFLLLAGVFLPVIAQIVTIWLMGRLTAVAILSSTGFNHAFPPAEIAKISRSKPCIRGFGVTAYLLSIIPGGIIFLLPGFIIGGTEMFHTELKEYLTACHR